MELNSMPCPYIVNGATPSFVRVLSRRAALTMAPMAASRT